MDIKAKKSVKIAALVVAVCIIAVVIYALPFAFSGAKTNAIVVVTVGDEPLKQIYDAEGESYGSHVETVLSILGVDLSKRLGGYSIEEGESPLTVARKIRNHNQVSIKFTFHDIRTKEQFAERVSSKFMMSKNDLLNLLNDSTFCASLGKTPETVVSVFLPDTYEFFYTITPDKFVKRLAEYYDKYWTSERKAKASALGLTPDEVSIIASIVEEETAQSNERGMVARLYINRYKSGMKLQADPTVKFAIGDFSIKRITHNMLFTESPYNTYKYAGLPPGPIRIPERSTLDAVLNAPEHKFTYMCAKEDFSGYHNFTSSYAEHQANAAKYQSELNKRGIK